MNILFQGCQNYHINIAEKLFTSTSLKPKYFITYEHLFPSVKRQFPNTIIHSKHKAIKGVFPENEKFDDLIDYDVIKHFEKDIRQAISLLDRNDSNTNSFLSKNRIQFCHKQISYWHWVLKYYKIDLVFFEEEPHQCFDYLLYKVSKFLNKQTIMFIRTIDEIGIIPSLGYERQNINLLNNYKEDLKRYESGKKIDFDEYVIKYFDLLKGEYDKVFERHLWDQASEFKKILANKFYLPKYIINNIHKIFYLNNWKLESDQKVKSKRFENSNLDKFNFIFYKIKTAIKKDRLKRFYQKNAIKVDFNKKYVLCALQYQPEKSTNPLGRLFENQILMIHSLRKNISKDTCIYVKEHPSQFVNSYSRYGESFRSKAFYEEISEIPNTYLVDMNSNIFDLIDHSEFVCSVTGSISWESIIRGKKALVLGDAWYKGCEGIYSIDFDSPFNDTLKKLLASDHPNLTKIMIFCQTIRNLGFNAVIGGEHQLVNRNMTNKENGEILFNGIKWLLKENNII